MSETTDDIAARHRKEIKALEGEQRAAVKKTKTTAGKAKKAKEAVAAVEAEYATKTNEMKARHATELELEDADGEEEKGNGELATAVAIEPVMVDTVAVAEQERIRQRQLKAVQKRERAREKELARLQAIGDETAAAGPEPRDVEMDFISQKLPAGMTIEPVAADGHCLYRAVAAQVVPVADYTHIRGLAADTLLQHETDFSPFCEFTDDMPDYKTYVQRVRSSADWGGHLELRVLSMALKRPITVYSVGSVEPLVIAQEEHQSDAVNCDPIRLSYHLQYYSLGEHYNQVVEKA